MATPPATPEKTGLTRGRRPSRSDTERLAETSGVVGGPEPSRLDMDATFHEPEWTWQKTGDVGWWVKPGWQPTLIGTQGLRLEQWRAEGKLSIVKSGPHRTVYRADLTEGPVYIKHYLVPSFREMWRQWLRRGKGRNEAKRAFSLAGHGVLTIDPIALGEQRPRKLLYENYLVSPEIAGSMPLDLFIERNLEPAQGIEATRLRKTLTREVARLTARLHNAGAVHQDFHAGNILVRSLGGDQIELAMIDLDALRFRRQLSWSEARVSLAQLNHGFWQRCTRSDRLRFLQTYLNERTTPGPNPASFARSIENATTLWAERMWRRSSRRCHGTNKYFHTRKAPGAWAVASRSLDTPTIDLLLQNPDAPFSQSATTILKDSRTTTVAETILPVDGKPTAVIYKRFNRKKWLDPWLALFRPSRGWRSWNAGQHLAVREVPTPRNLLYLRQNSNQRTGLLRLLRFLPRETYLVTLKAEPSITLTDWIRDELAQATPANRQQRIRRYTYALARLLRLMHERSLSHRDLKAANILIVGDPDSQTPALCLIDLVGVDLESPLSQRRRIQNLARLHLSLLATPGRTHGDSLRFLRWYLQREDKTETHWKTIWHAVSKAAGTKTAQNERRGRPLT